MKKSSRSIIIVAISLLIVGGVLTGGGVAMGGSIRNWPRQLRAIEYVRFPGWLWDYNSANLSSYSETLPGFTSIAMDTVMGNITIEYGVNNRIELIDCAVGYISFSVEGDRLTITESRHDFGVRSGGFPDGKSPTIRITVPHGTVLTGLAVSHDLGSLTCRVPITGDRVYIDLDLGSARLDDIRANRVDIDLDLGELTANNITADRLSAELDLGSASFHAVAARRVEVDCDLGSLELNLIGRLSDYSYDIDTGVGSAKLDGTQLRLGGNHKLDDPSRPYRLEADVELGELNITFTDPGDTDPFSALPK